MVSQHGAWIIEASVGGGGGGGGDGGGGGGGNGGFSHAISESDIYMMMILPYDIIICTKQRQLH